MNKIILIIIGILLTVSMVSSAEAVTINSFKFSTDLSNPSNNELYFIQITNNSSERVRVIELFLPSTNNIVKVTDSFGNAGFTVIDNKNIKITLNNVLNEGESETIFIEKTFENKLTVREGFNEYVLAFTPLQNIESFEHYLKLPENALLYTENDTVSLVVPSATIGVTNNKTTIEWQETLTAERPVVFIVRFRLKEEESNDFASGALIILVSLGVGMLLGVLILKRLKHLKKKEALKISGFLNEKEKIVLQAIIKKDGLNQYELMHSLGYTKSSLSKIISKLEQKGLIERKKFGKINKLFYKEKQVIVKEERMTETIDKEISEEKKQ
ncbi:MAG: MarR family transcriptional regulator [archaeon]